MASGPKKVEDKDADATEVIKGDPETLNAELQKAKEQDACLIVIRGPHQGHRYFIHRREMIIGRDPNADISIPEQSISRKHARVLAEAGRVQVTDLGSANGTLLNGRKLATGDLITLAKEDMLRLGNTILKFLPAGELETLVYGSLESAAHTDPLTKIYNKRYLLQALDAEFKRAKALHNDFTILFFDIDHFKRINDTYGHDAGDYVLREMSNLVRSKFMRPKDVFARYGGEEFVILLFNTNGQTGETRAEDIRKSVEAYDFVYEGTRIPLTLSIGVTEVDQTIESAQTLLKKADQALYSAKNGGRNRVVLA